MTSVNNQNEIIQVYTQLLSNFNGYYEFASQAKNLIDGTTYTFTVNNQFLTVRQKFPASRISISHWKVTRDLLTTPFAFADKAKFLGTHEGEIDFYIPSHVIDLFPALGALGPAHTVYEGALGLSGRSIWVFRPGLAPICLKIDTLRYPTAMAFNQRRLDLSDIEHSLQINAELSHLKNLFTEDHGVSIEFDPNQVTSKQTHYGYLVRLLDFDKTNIEKSDFLIPMTALVSDDFYKNTKLLASMQLENLNVSTLFSVDLPRALATLIRQSFLSSIHFELHQQNLTAHFRKGRFIKLIYHDLLDVVIDPICFLADRLRLQSSSALELHEQLEKLSTTAFFNLQDEMQVAANETHKFTVTSFYRRYLRNFGNYSRTYNHLLKKEYFLGLEFESKLLEALNFTETELQTNNFNHPQAEFLKKQLFWCLQRFHQNQQDKAFRYMLDQLANEKLYARNAVTQNELKKLFQENKIVLCGPVPIQLINIVNEIASTIYFELNLNLNLFVFFV
ncbi:MAG: hypothetical protein H7061_00610 [Bdellovibrionaceae bacterium]|nr:hypothetical protein [Bdellovibrio sp.]